MKFILLALDLFLYGFHLILVLFNVFGGFIPSLRKLHCLSLVITLLSWLGLGYFYGWGYCFLTDWHFAVRERLGKHDPYENYLQLLFAGLGIDLTPHAARVLAIAGLSLGIGSELYFFFRTRFTSLLKGFLSRLTLPFSRNQK